MNLVSNNLVLIPVKYNFENHGKAVEMLSALWRNTQCSLDYRTLFPAQRQGVLSQS